MVRDRLKESQRPSFAFFAAAALANLIAIGAGLASGLSYLAGNHPTVAAAFRQHRAVHVLFAIAWIYLAGVAILYHAMSADPPPGFRRRARWHLGLWALAGVGSLVSLSLGRFSGRPYLEAPAVWSLAILAGWSLLAYSFKEWLRARQEPPGVRHFMWGMSLALFLAAFAEAHLHLMPALSARPVRDIGVQWKSYGTLVGTFNLLVYAGVSYIGARRAGKKAPETTTGVALFLVGALNTFTNYGHHTFHVAQSAWVQWAGFLVSCTEIAIVAALLGELLAARPNATDAGTRWLRWGRFWSFVMVSLAILLSIPPLNTLAHGTYLVMAHAMGSMIGIDTVLLLACIAAILEDDDAVTGLRARWTSVLVNGGLAVILVALIARGSADAALRALGPLAPAPPDVLRFWQLAFVCGGAAVALGMALVDIWILLRMARALRRSEGHVHGSTKEEVQMHNDPVTILIVDDDADLLEILGLTCKKRGFDARLVPDVGAALLAIEERLPSLILSDVRLPGRSGLELLREVHARHPHVPVVMMTAFDSDDVIALAGRLGAYRVLSKPVTRDDLFRTLGDALAA